jgi:hypothetical protein
VVSDGDKCFEFDYPVIPGRYMNQIIGTDFPITYDIKRVCGGSRQVWSTVERALARLEINICTIPLGGKERLREGRGFAIETQTFEAASLVEKPHELSNDDKILGCTRLNSQPESIDRSLWG